jgi:superfamily II DNA/RNA helicase
MCPTRELVVQNLDVLRKMGKHTGISAVGVNELRIGRSLPPIRAQIVIGTAGKITNLIASRKLTLDNVKVLVFDEADEMMKVDGFKDTSVRMIQEVRKVSEGVQILLFSATFDDSVKSYVTKVPSQHPACASHEYIAPTYSCSIMGSSQGASGSTRLLPVRHCRERCQAALSWCSVSRATLSRCSVPRASSAGRAGARCCSCMNACVQIMPSANKVFVEKEQLSLDVIKQYRVDVTGPAQKDEILQEYILKNADRLGQTIIFVATRRTAQALYEVCSDSLRHPHHREPQHRRCIPIEP